MHKCYYFCLVVLACLVAHVSAYESSIPHVPKELPVYTSEWTVHLEQGQSPNSLVELGFEVVGKVGNLNDWYVVKHKATQTRHERERAAVHSAAKDVTSSLLLLKHVKSAEQSTLVTRKTRITISDPLFSSQWHLQNTGQFNGVAGNDANLQGAWDAGYTGNGVQVAIVDDGFQHTHPDLSGRYVASASQNFRGVQSSDPSPDVSEDFHGTSAAGVAIAERNSYCGVGAAFEASGAGIRLIGSAITPATEATGMTFQYQSNDIFSNSWGPADDGIFVGSQADPIPASLLDAVTTGRGGLGNVFVWSAGNGAKYNDNSNYDGFANSRFVIAVGAVGNNGVHSYYSEPGANVVVTAPSDSANPNGGIRTIDLVGTDGYDDSDCTSDFGGTSSACPLVTGIVALMLQANPSLTWRDVPVILAATARETAASGSDSDWVINGGGYHVNHKYGFGVVDAAAAVTQAKNHTNLAALQTATASASPNAAIPDNSATGVTASLSISDSFIVERVVVTVTAPHTSSNDLQIVLTAPSGTKSVLAELHGSFPSISFGSSSSGVFQLGPAVFGPTINSRITGTFVNSAPDSSCSFSSCSALRGAIVAINLLTTRCQYDSSVFAAQNCGAVGVVFYNPNLAADNTDALTIPASAQSYALTIPAGYMPGEAYATGQSYFGQTVSLGRLVYTGINNYENGWAFQSIRHLGEQSAGTWRVTVSDLRSGITGTFSTVSINVYGSNNAAAFPPGHVYTPTTPTSSSSATAASVALLALGAIVSLML